MSVLEGPIVLVDIETNGLNHIRGRIIEIGVIRIENGQITQTFKQLLDPETPIPHFITQLTGITDADVADAPTFAQIAEELYEILDGAVFIAHNVRFDYSFIKQELLNVGKAFQPKQLCTVRLSRALYPEYRSHKLADIIARHAIPVAARHRAYDDAAVLWEFLQIVQRDFAADTLQAAIGKQIKQPALPKGLDADIVAGLPDSPGVYIFEDEAGRPLYVGKSIHVRTRVRSHFAADHEQVSEFKISQSVCNVRVHETAGELEALLLESRLVKELQPLFNKQLRRTSKLLIAKQVANEDGYHTIRLEAADTLDTDDIPQVLAVYTHRGKAKAGIEQIVKDWTLCPKLAGLEKRAGPCFLLQLGKCQGACAGQEPPSQYNQRLSIAFERHRVQEWPYASPVLVCESGSDDRTVGIVVDQWCILGQVVQEAYCSPVFLSLRQAFDIDTYRILRSSLASTVNRLKIVPLTQQQLHDFTTQSVL
jgi:DNA polymerase-3 subunit epsilon